MSILDGNILEDHGNSRGGGGLKQKCPQWGGEGGYGYFLELHMMMYCFLSWPLIISNFNLQPIKYISQIDIPAQLFHYEILQLILRRSFMGKRLSFLFDLSSNLFSKGSIFWYYWLFGFHANSIWIWNKILSKIRLKWNQFSLFPFRSQLKCTRNFQYFLEGK